MKNSYISITTLLVAMLLLVPGAQAQEDPEFQSAETQKLAQAGFKFLSFSVDPRSAAMGSAMTGVGMNSSVAMFYNPATMAYQTSNFHAAANQAQWIADITYNAASASFAPSGGSFGIIGVSVMAVDYGEFIGTIRDDTESGYRDIGTFSPTALSVGLGYARALTDRFAVGGNVKYVTQDLGNFPVEILDGGGLGNEDFSKSTVAFDFGVLYNTGFRSLTFAMSARNFARELQYDRENFELPLTFRIGVSVDAMDFTNMNTDMHSFKVAVEAERPRDFAEQLRVGGEYLFMNTLALRAGVSFPSDIEGGHLGVGLQRDFGTFGFAFNYAYTLITDDFDNISRFGVQVSF